MHTCIYKHEFIETPIEAPKNKEYSMYMPQDLEFLDPKQTLSSNTYCMLVKF